MDEISIYTAEGWKDEDASLDYGRILDYAERKKLLPIRTESDAIRATNAAYGWGGRGLWIGKKTVRRLGNWRWFAAWKENALRAPLEDAEYPQ